jgi:TolB-like protein
MDPTHFVRELRRRGVFRGAAFYVVAAWVTLQVSDLALPGLGLPESAIRFVWIGAFLGFPLALFFSWRYEFTRDGVVRTPPASGEAFDVRLRAIDWVLIAALLSLAGVIAYGVASGVRQARAPVVASLAPALEGRLAIAVLPFRNVSGDPGQEYFSDGITDEMILQLGRLHPERLAVIARTSAMRYKNADQPVGQIGKELGVGYLLEGSVLREGDRVRINVQLVQASDATQLWADSYERELSSVMEMQRDVAQAVAKSLALRLLPEEQARLARVGKVNPEAYDAYLKGSQYWIRLGRADLDAAEKYFNLALEKDPNFAAAYAGLAMVWSCRKQMAFVDPKEAGPRMAAAARKAIELDDTLPEAHVAMGGLLSWTDWDWAAARREWERAIELNPNYPDPRVFYSHYLLMMGEREESLRQVEKAVAVDPFNVIFKGFYAVVLIDQRRPDDAIEAAKDVLEVMPDNPVALQAAWFAYEMQGAYEEAFGAAKSYFGVLYGVLDSGGGLDRTFATQGYRAAMRQAAELLDARGESVYVNPTDVAFAYQSAGDHERAIDWLERAYEARDPNLPYLRWAGFDALRSNPRFQALVRKMNLPE